MNVHDAERMAGLLEQSGYDRAESDVDADLVVINTCSVRERAEEKLYTRLGELKEMGRELGRDPIVAVTGCVAQQEGEKLIKRSAGVVDVVVGTQQMKMLPMLTTQALALSERGSAVRRPARVERALIAIENPYRGAVIPARRGAARRSGARLRHHHRGLQRLLRVLRGAVHARPRADAVEEGNSRRRPGGGRQRTAGSAAARPDRQPLPGAGRSLLRLSGIARSGARDIRHRAHPVRQPASAAHQRPLDRCRPRLAEGLQASAPSRPVGIDARARADAAAPHARELPRAGCTHSRGYPERAAIDRYDRWVSRRNGRRFRRTRCR